MIERVRKRIVWAHVNFTLSFLSLTSLIHSILTVLLFFSIWLSSDSKVRKKVGGFAFSSCCTTNSCKRQINQNSRKMNTFCRFSYGCTCNALHISHNNYIFSASLIGKRSRFAPCSLLIFWTTVGLLWVCASKRDQLHALVYL